MVLVSVGKTIYPDGECFGVGLDFEIENPEEITVQKLTEIWKRWEDESVKLRKKIGDVWDKGDEEIISIFCEDEATGKKLEKEAESTDIPTKVLVGVTL
jgi:ssRNA-specific RNase YbeY (16S rRNA maturation enzyme)